jgi:hypothetical protein
MENGPHVLYMIQARLSSWEAECSSATADPRRARRPERNGARELKKLTTIQLGALGKAHRRFTGEINR